MKIRKCNKDDIKMVGDFYDKVVCYLEAHVNYPKWTYKVYPCEESAKIKIESGEQYICVEDDTIVGAFVLNDDPQGNYENAVWSQKVDKTDYLVCHTLATDPNCQGKGIGKRMVAFCIDYAKKNGYQAVRLDVVPENTPARKLYETCCFQYVGDVDLERDIPEIPLFSMYEYNL